MGLLSVNAYDRRSRSDYANPTESITGETFESDQRGRQVAGPALDSHEQDQDQM